MLLLAALPIPESISMAVAAVIGSVLCGVIAALWAWGNRKDARWAKDLKVAEDLKDKGMEAREKMRKDLQTRIDGLVREKDALQERMLAREKEIAAMQAKEPAVDRAMEIIATLQRQGVIPGHSPPVPHARSKPRSMTEKMAVLDESTAQIDLSELKRRGLLDGTQDLGGE